MKAKLTKGILLILSLPSWFWFTGLGLLLVGVGYLLWRFL